jgi:hypothetical protein
MSKISTRPTSASDFFSLVCQRHTKNVVMSKKYYSKVGDKDRKIKINVPIFLAGGKEEVSDRFVVTFFCRPIRMYNVYVHFTFGQNTHHQISPKKNFYCSDDDDIC